ncbi:MAG: transcriptional repressor [Bacteroidales bacterium]|nr:transcriptional repressor [Bacteroidales bacterium]
MLNQTKKAPTLEEFKVILKKNGLKATPQRLAVHEAMLSLGHASVDMVTESISANTTKTITVASAYNILSQLADLGIYSRRTSSNCKMYFDVNSGKHIHLYDSEGNEYKDIIDDELIAMVEAKLGRRRFKGYKVDSIDIQIICHPSKKKLV